MLTKQFDAKEVVQNNWMYLQVNIPDIRLILLDWVTYAHKKVCCNSKFSIDFQLKVMCNLLYAFYYTCRSSVYCTFEYQDLVCIQFSCLILPGINNTTRNTLHTNIIVARTRSTVVSEKIEIFSSSLVVCTM